MKTKLTMILILWAVTGSSQVMLDDFKDGLESDPTWKGDTASFKTVGGSLWSDHQTTYDEFAIYTEIPQVEEFEWVFNGHLHFNTSSVNYMDIGLFTDSEFIDGLVIRVGGTPDHISLFHVASGNYEIEHAGVEKTVIDQPFQVTVNFKDGTLEGRFQTDAYMEDWLNDSLVTDATRFSYLQIKIKQSTASFIGKHEIETIRYGLPEVDTVPPAITSVIVPGKDRLVMVLSETLNSENLPQVNVKYQNISLPVKELVFIAPDSLVLIPEQHFYNGKQHNAVISGLCDVLNNCNDTMVVFTSLYHEEVGFGDVIISEIMVDPEPAVELPPYEYIELFNRSSKIVNLSELELLNGSKSIRPPSFFLLPDSFVALTGSTDWQETEWPNVIQVTGLFTLANTEGEIQLTADSSVLIHEVRYAKDDITDQAKVQGGWSLEMCDLDRFCTERGNWRVSLSSSGGTPGKQNSQNFVVDDYDVPVLRSVGLKDDRISELHFNEVIYPGSNVYLEKNGREVNVEGIDYSFNSVVLDLSEPVGFEVKNYIIFGIGDCYGNVESAGDTFQLARPVKVDQGSVVINEVLFDNDQSEEYFELWNQSGKTIDLYGMALRSRSSGGEWSSAAPLVNASHLLFPGQYVCFTNDKDRVIGHFQSSAAPDRIFNMDLPRLNDKSAFLGIANHSLDWIDTLKYDHSMHYNLLDDVNDVSLERLSADQPELTSATPAVDYGTPGAINSTVIKHTEADTESGIWLSCDPFTPDFDGLNDRLVIGFIFEESFRYSLSVYRRDGSLAASLVENGFAVDQMQFIWDGSGNNYEMLKAGIYFIVVEYWTAEKAVKRRTKCVSLHY